MKEKTVKELTFELSQNQRTISDLVVTYLEYIKAYDSHLNAISELNPEVDNIIKELELSPKKSILHGIPIMIKDNIQTKDHMHTTANSYALAEFFAPFDATIVKKI